VKLLKRILGYACILIYLQSAVIALLWDTLPDDRLEAVHPYACVIFIAGTVLFFYKISRRK